MRAAWRLEGLQLYANVIKEIYKSAEPQRDSLCTAGSQTWPSTASTNHSLGHRITDAVFELRAEAAPTPCRSLSYATLLVEMLLPPVKLRKRSTPFSTDRLLQSPPLCFALAFTALSRAAASMPYPCAASRKQK